jgi:hypothetical protein
MMKWIGILFLEFFPMYFEMQIFIIFNNHESDVGMNGSVKFVETQDMNNEHMHMKCKFVVIVMWNILQEFKFHLYQKGLMFNDGWIKID